VKKGIQYVCCKVLCNEIIVLWVGGGRGRDLILKLIS